MNIFKFSHFIHVPSFDFSYNKSLYEFLTKNNINLIQVFLREHYTSFEEINKFFNLNEDLIYIIDCVYNKINLSFYHKNNNKFYFYYFLIENVNLILNEKLKYDIQNYLILG